MTDEPYADPALRAALGTLLADEPPSPPTVDDVARGRALRRRRRTRAGAVAVLAAVVVGVVTVGVVARPGIVTQPPADVASSPTTTASPALSAAMRRAKNWLIDHGWTVVSTDVRPGSPVTGREEGELHVAAAGSPSTTPQATLRVVLYPHSRPYGVYAARCTDASCQQGAPVFDCGFSGGVACAADRVTLADVAGVGAGARILDEELQGSYGLLEVVAGPAPKAAGSSPAPFLSEGDIRDLVAAVGDPYPPSSGLPTASPVAPPCRASDVVLAAAALPSGADGVQALAIEVTARDPQVRCTVTGRPTVSGLLDRDDRALPFTPLEPLGPGSPAAVLVSRDSAPSAGVVIFAGTCPVGSGTAASSLRMTLPGDDAVTTVELAEGLGPTSCPQVSREGTPFGIGTFFAKDPEEDAPSPSG